MLIWSPSSSDICSPLTEVEPDYSTDNSDDDNEDEDDEERLRVGAMGHEDGNIYEQVSKNWWGEGVKLNPCQDYVSVRQMLKQGKRVNNMIDSNPIIVIESYSYKHQPTWVAVAASVDHPPT